MNENKMDNKSRYNVNIFHNIMILVFFTIVSNGDLRHTRLVWWGAFSLVLITFFIAFIKNDIIVRKETAIYMIWSTLFIGFTVLSSLWARDIGLSIKGVKAILVAHIVLWTIVVLNPDRTDLLKIMKLYIAASLINSVYIFCAIDLSTLGNVRIGAESLGEGWNANRVGMTMAFSAFMTCFLLKKQRNIKNKLPYWIIVGLFSIITLLTGSRKALFILVFAPFLFYYLISENKLKSTVLILIGGVISLFLIMNVTSLYNVIGKRAESLLFYFTKGGKVDWSTRTRVDMIKYGFSWFREKPIIGFGINNYSLLHGLATGRYTYAHNNYIELLVGIGLLGTLIYYFAYFYIFKKSLAQKTLLSTFSIVIIITLLIIETGLVSYNTFYIQLLICVNFIAISREEDKHMLMTRILNLVKNPKRIVPVLANRGFLNWLGDDRLLEIQFKDRMGDNLNLDNPQTFNEKLQWLKLYDRNPKYTSLVDKYEVRKYIAKTIGDEYLIPLLGVWDKFEDIDFSKLPNQFVLKCTHDSGGVVICTDKSQLDINATKKLINKSLRRNFYYFAREWPYKNIKPRIICEKYMEDESGEEIKDYKLMCFNGEVKCTFVCLNRNSLNGLNIDIYDASWDLMPVQRPNAPNSGTKISRPKNYDEMVRIAQKLSKDIPFVRVDFYEVNGKLYFGELTFYPAAGFGKFVPEHYDNILGSWIDLPSKKLV